MSQLMKKKFPSITSIDVGSDGNTSFLRAARNGQLEKVLEHLESNIDINTSNANGLNALHLASKDGHVEIVEELLKRGAVIDAATKKGNTALHIASLAGQEEVVKLLVNHGASVNVQSQNGFTPLYMAAQENHDNVVKYLLANGANQSLSTEDGFTPLAVAMQQGHDKVVTVLLENDTRGKVRLPALHIAAKKDDVKAAKLLLENEHNPDVTSKSGFTPLHIASHYGNQAIANLLVQKGADVNYAAKHNITPLHVAAKWGKTNMVTVLLEQGANIESKTRDGLTPLHCAARSGHEQVVDMLLEKGAPISSKTKNGLAPLHMAAQGDHVDAARILLYHRAPVDEVTVDYLTALHVAAHCGHVRVAKLLLDRQADANARALNGFTPLHIACKKNRIKVVELLLKHGASIGATTESGLTPLHVASFMGCMNIVIYLLQHDASPDVPTVRGETPLHLAARANQTDIIRILLRNGAQVDARAREQQTPLHIASRLGNVDIVMLLLQHGAQVDNTTKDMYTALHIAAKEGQDEVAAALIENGASLNATTKKGFTPLHLAAKYGHLKVAKLLLQKEAPVDAQGKNGVTPLHVASHYDHQNVALLLLEKGASPYATAKNGHTALHIAAKKNQMDIANTLLEYGAKPNAESKAGFTPLHLSAQEGHCDMTDLLIEHKADPNYNAKNGLTPLHLCAQEDKVPVAEILVKNGGEVDAVTKNEYTPLHIACHYGQINMVRFLLAHGANVKATTSLGYTPLHQAAQQGHTNIVNTLLENSAQPNATTNNGQTPLHIAEKLGYITVIDTLKVVTQPLSPITTSISNDEKYRVVAPEAMHETFMSDSEEEGGEDTVLGDQTYRYLTADEMKSLGDDSLPIDVTRDERIDSNKMVSSTENMLPPRHIEESISPEHVQQNYVEYIKKYTPDNVDIDRHPINIGFLVSFLVDARGGAMRGCRHSGVRVIVPPRCAASPTRITCRYVRPQRTPHPPPLMEGEALASRVLELGPVGAKFLGPVIIEVPHFAALRGKEREIVILRSDNGESWKEHMVDATDDVLNDVLHDSFEAEDLNQLEDVSLGRITRIVTQDFPQYFAVVSRIRQEVHAIGPEGGMVSSTVVPQVQAVFPQGALTKKIKVGLQAQPIDPELTAKLLGHGVAVSPVVTIEPRRRKFHKPIMLSMPAPRAHSQGMINQYSGNAPTLRLLCSITGGTTKAHWEDVTGSTPLNFVNDCVTFTTTVSARFWLMDCRNVDDATKMATALYSEAIHVPFMAKFVVFAKRVDPLEARLRVFCMTDDKEDKTLEHQEHFTEVAKSRDVEVLEGKSQYIEFAGNLVPITKSGEQLQFSFRAFRENRLPFSVRVKDQHAEAVSRCLFMREAKLPKGEPPQQPICILNIVLPEDIVVDTISLTDTDSVKKLEHFDYYRPDPRLADMSNLLGEDWVPLATHLGLTTSEINVIKSEYPDSVAKQAQSMLRMWLSQSGNKAQTNTLESALKKIGREDIIPQCLNVDYASPGIKEIGKQRLIKAELEHAHYEKDIMKDSESVQSLRKSEEEKKNKYSAEEKVVEETSDEEDFNKTVSERRHQIEEQLSVDRTVPASSQRVEIVQEISSIKRQSLVENKRVEVEQKTTGEFVDELKTTVSSNELMTSPVNDKVYVDRRDSALLEGVTQRFEQKTITNITSVEDPKSPKLSKTPPPSPADFIIKEQATAIQDWDASKKPAIQEYTSDTQDAEQQGLSTTTERIIASNEEKLLDKPVGRQLTGLSVIDDHSSIDLKTLFEQTNAFIQSESQPEPFDPLVEKYTRKEPISTKKIDNKNNMNEKKKAKKGFFGSIKTFVERSMESDSESEKSPKKSKKPKKDKKKKSKEGESKMEESLPPRKPKLPTPPLAPSDLDNIPFVEVSASDLPPSYNPPDIPKEEVEIPVTDLDADLDLDQTIEVIVPVSTKEEPPRKSEKEQVKQQLVDIKEKDKVKEKKKTKPKTIIVEEVTKTIEPLVIEAEQFSIVVDPTKKGSPKKSKETFTINIDESFDKIEKEIMEKSPILSEEKIVKPVVEFQPELPLRPVREHVYEDIEPIPSSVITETKIDVTSAEIFKAVDEPNIGIVEKQDKEMSKESDIKADVAEVDGKRKGERKTSFFGLFKKKDAKKEEDAVEQNMENIENLTISESVMKDMNDSKNFLLFEVENYDDDRTTKSDSAEETVIESKPEAKEIKIQSEGFFGLFKKQKNDEKETKSETVEPTKLKKDDKKVEQSKVVAFSEDVLRNMLDSKRFLESEVKNYDDAPRTTSLEIEEKMKAEEFVETKTESTPKKEKEASPKPGLLTGLLKKLRKDDSETQETNDIPSHQVLIDMKETEDFLVSEVTNYHDVKYSSKDTKVCEIEKSEDQNGIDVLQSKPLEIKEIVKVSHDSPQGLHAESTEDKTEPLLNKTVQEEKEASSKPGVFTNLFKKFRRDESGSQESKDPVSEQVFQDMKKTEEFLVGEVTNYHDAKTSDKHTKDGETLEVEEIVKVNDAVPQESTEKNILIKAEPLLKTARDEEKESSPKPGLFTGLFKKLRKDEPDPKEMKDALSDQVLQDMKQTQEFLVEEVTNYQDVKLLPEQTKISETVETLKTEEKDIVKSDEYVILEAEKTDEAKEQSQKPFSGILGLFKKSKKDEEESEAAIKSVLSELVVQNIKDTNQFLLTEVDNYHDVKPNKFEKIEQEKIDLISEEESSPKTTRGLFRIFKKQKKDESVDNKGEISKEARENINDTQSSEVESDVKPEQFEKSDTAVSVVRETSVEASPKSSRGIFGVFKKSKKECETPKDKSTISETVQKDIADSQVFLSTEVENYNDVKLEEIKTEVTAEVPSATKSSSGLFGIFKKSKKCNDEADDTENVIQQIEATDHFLVDEIQNYEDVKPAKFALIEQETNKKSIDENIESSPKQSRGLFGIFKKGKKEDELVIKNKIVSDEIVEDIASTGTFLKEEVENYHDVKVQENIKTVTEETSETFLKPVLQESVKKIDTLRDDVPEKILITEQEQNDKATIKTSTEDGNVKVEGEVKTGFLNKYKKTKKSVTVIEPEESKQQVREDMKNTSNFLLTELKNYEDAKTESNVNNETKEEKTVTFRPTKPETVSEGQLTQPETVVELAKKDPDVVKDSTLVDETASLSLKDGLEETERSEEHEVKSSKKDKQSKDKKGFFNIFGRKTKSEETKMDEHRRPSEVDTEGSPKKQKPRKSSSPFKFFDKMKKSEDDSKTIEPEPIQAIQTEVTTTEEPKEDLLTTEFTEPSINLSDEVLGSLDRKMEALKSKYNPDTQKQINDCRDFLFIEVDNYEDGKSVLTTDIDTDLSNNALKTVDSIIDNAKKVVQKVSEQKSIERISKLGDIVTKETEVTTDISRDLRPSVVEPAISIFKDDFKDDVTNALSSLTNLESKLTEDVTETSKQILPETQKSLEQVGVTIMETKERLISLGNEIANNTDDIKGTLIEKKYAATEKVKNICDLKDSTKKAMAKTQEMLKTGKAEYENEKHNGKDSTTKNVDQDNESGLRKKKERIDTKEDASEHTPEAASKKSKVDNLTPKEVDLLFTAYHDIPTGAISATAKIVEQKTDEVSKNISDTTKTALEDLQDVVQKTTQKVVDGFTGIPLETDIAGHKTDELKEISSQIIDNLTIDDQIAKLSSASQAVDDIFKKSTQSVDNLSSTITKASLQELESVTKTVETDTDLSNLTKNIGDIFEQRVEDITKVKKELIDEGKFSSIRISDSIDKSAASLVSETKQAVGEKMKEKLDEVIRAPEQEKETLFETGVQKVQVLDDAVKEGVEKLKEKLTDISYVTSAPEVLASFEDKNKGRSDKVQTSSTTAFEELTEVIPHDQSLFTSYVTSPTMARRAESQRFPRGERPTVREIKASQLDSDSDEEHYTVTEPEDIHQNQDRKPLFHMESEDDDFVEIGKSRVRQDSVKSNVLETLGDNKLDNLLSDLEQQLVKDLEESVTESKVTAESKVTKAESELELIQKDSQADVKQIEEKLRDLDKALDSLEQPTDPKLEKKLHRVERKFERMASEAVDKDEIETSPTEVERSRENEFQRLVSQLSTEEVSDFQKEYSHLWDETTFSKSDDWDSKTPDSQVDVQELPQGEESGFAATGEPGDSGLKVENEEVISGGQQATHSSSQERPIADQHQLSEEMKLLMKELEEESKQ